MLHKLKELRQTHQDFSRPGHINKKAYVFEQYNFFFSLKADNSEINVAVSYSKVSMSGFPGGAVVENLPANAGDTGSSPGLGRSHMPRSN